MNVSNALKNVIVHKDNDDCITSYVTDDLVSDLNSNSYFVFSCTFSGCSARKYAVFDTTLDSVYFIDSLEVIKLISINIYLLYTIFQHLSISLLFLSQPVTPS